MKLKVMYTLRVKRRGLTRKVPQNCRWMFLRPVNSLQVFHCICIVEQFQHFNGSSKKSCGKTLQEEYVHFLARVLGLPAI